MSAGEFLLRAIIGLVALGGITYIVWNEIIHEEEEE